TEPHDRLADAPRLHQHGLEADDMSGNTQPEQMRMDTFELEQDGADVAGPARRFDARRLLHRLAIAGGMDEAANPADSFSQIRDLAVSQNAVAELFNSPVVVEEAGIA